MALIDDFKARFPGIPATDAALYIPILEPVWPEYYGKSYADRQEAVLNLLAHLLTMESSTGARGLQTVSSKSVAGVSESYAVAAPSQPGTLADFNATKYGQRFLALTRSDFGCVAV